MIWFHFILIFLSISTQYRTYTRYNSETSKTIRGKVVKIVDGDTFDLLTIADTIVRVRLQGIDCPERKQDYCQKAKDYLGALVFGREVVCTYLKTDRNKRIIGDVYSGKDHINFLMVQEGFAWHYKKYSSDLKLAEAEPNARKAKREIWSVENQIPPWEYRNN